MSNPLEDRVISYIRLNQDLIINHWMEKVVVSIHDPYKEEVKSNGFSMLYLILSCLNNQTNEDEIKLLAFKVASERLEANVNIGDFVYNVSLGRSEILNTLPQTGLSIEELHPMMNKINFYFDKFLHLAVQRYTELKDKRLEEQSFFIEQTHKDRLTILGQMSSSFVHEFRNPLTSVIGFIKLLREKYGTIEYLDIIDSELDQLKYRISQFLLTSRKESKEKEKEYIHIPNLCEETLDFIYPILVSTDVTIESDIVDDSYLYGYRDEFRQVLINILINSLDALSESHQSIKKIYIASHIEQDRVIITISNNGPMIPSHSIHSIFEPFYSTKKLGTGIGLYICRKIIEEHNGTLHCESNQNWTHFRMMIPIRNVTN
ncbi:histidine kinase N-terminal domain-containing protein [Ammoniphilus sp. CFH 90114]|uniref:histidine kinase N-terminal domain-containing protein n=1 Tax=Ammoniphilus sp. CFH 90114 TaxID=2493665 RepID=UPI00100E3B72|nr:histidine kinase N-terminal domain-containing protein [Ammoniphilus sp. CFH 90114]RXT06510.1 GHKL domain-containing protein [Ammoniphilus sp. CFH 90114]